MVPSAIVVVDALPLTVNGKLDRRALPAPSAAVVRSPRGARAAVTGELERLIADEWQAVLQLDAVGATDNFFDVGGHSLHMATLQSRLIERVSAARCRWWRCSSTRRFASSPDTLAAPGRMRSRDTRISRDGATAHGATERRKPPAGPASRQP